MGAGLFAIPSFLKAVTATISVIATPRARWSLGIAMAPWVFGILTAIAGRLSLRGLTSRHNLYHFENSVRLQALLVKLLNKPPEEVAPEVLETLNEAGGLKKQRETTESWRWWSRKLFNLTHVLMALGVITVTALISLYAR